MSVVEFPGTSSRRPCFVRVLAERPEGFIEFEFAIGDPSLCVELILPRRAFAEFCATNRVRHLGKVKAEASEAASWSAEEGSPDIDW